MTLRIHDTRQKRKVDFVPLVPGKAGVYACGVTVYDVCHVGHARMLVAFDVIVRHLRASGLKVRFVRNVTDVDDKIIRRAQTEGISPEAVARKYEDAMAADLAALGIAPPDDEPRATAHIPDIVALIERLCDRRPGLRGGRRRLLCGGRVPVVRRAVGTKPRRSESGRPHRNRRTETQSARLRAVEKR